MIPTIRVDWDWDEMNTLYEKNEFRSDAGLAKRLLGASGPPTGANRLGSCRTISP